MQPLKKHPLLRSLWLLGLIVAGNMAFAQLQQKEKTAFQVAAPWKETYDIRADVAIVYGINDAGGNFEERVKGYRDKGYNVQFMTGIAWGQYQDFFLGQFDGKTHWEDGQVTREGDTIWHGHHVPYIVPSKDYLTYIKTHIKRAIDAGVSAIYLEEPEFWARAGYSDSFKKEWQKYYGSPWVAQHTSPEATYLSSKLKYQLYFDALKDVFTYAKSYSKSQGKHVKCYVPTHSLINYSSWQIVSPEAALANLPGMDGYIAQVWTGTAREPVYFNGEAKERVFENAFLEYGSMVSMTAPTGKKMFFLTDPIEDRERSWDDYKRNYQATFTAKLLYPTVNNYEVMPWPDRIYGGKFQVEGSVDKQGIAPTYATQMQIMINALNEMPLAENSLNGSRGIGVLLANSMMFQRFSIHTGYEDPQLSNFYGMAMPLLKRGVPVETVHMENLMNEHSLQDIKVLIMSYANMKPLSPTYHEALAKWVNNGGTLIYYGRDDDPFQQVKEWWNTGENNFSTPSEHLFEMLNISKNETKLQHMVGKGKVLIVRKDPKELVMEVEGDKDFMVHVKTAYKDFAGAGKLELKNNFLLERGPYLIAAVLDEHVDKSPLVINGPVIDLFDPNLPVRDNVRINPGEQGFLYDLGKNITDEPKVLAAAARVYDEKVGGNGYSFTVKSPSNTINVMRISLPSEPENVTATGSTVDEIPLIKNQWDDRTKTLLLGFENYSEGVDVDIHW
ncbi:hypothetical protein H8S90_09345 [Olivibacter sp. SDN3]|uniref:hypothetical protein n=1 Tax=Olivibacter sp. SDN3 TaxID=2764720 RepID=UPI001651476A|nr:hypothetical protein [Olivibacter sp. SDN3]QNL51754.1 hypothetical protein H8S90_09345 [Olivibacter sp. SDN3]